MHSSSNMTMASNAHAPRPHRRTNPLEVKSGSRTRAKSLASFVQKHHPIKTIKLAATAGDAGAANNAAMVLPLYDACFVGQALQS